MATATTKIPGILLIGVIAFLCGCSPSGSTAPKAVEPPASAGVGGPFGSLEDNLAASAEADLFLKLVLTDPVAASARVAPAFKKQVTGTLIYEDEKKLGYSESDTQKYLKEACAGVTAWDKRTNNAPPGGAEFSIRGETKSASGPGRFAIRVGKQGGAWRVTRFGVSSISNATAQASGGGEGIWAIETAFDFVEALAAGDPNFILAMALMTESFKKRLPSPSIADAGLGYAKKDVRHWLNNVGKEMIAFKITDQVADNIGLSITGELGGSSKYVAFSLRLVKDADGIWTVDDFIAR